MKEILDNEIENYVGKNIFIHRVSDGKERKIHLVKVLPDSFIATVESKGQSEFYFNRFVNNINFKMYINE